MFQTQSVDGSGSVEFEWGDGGEAGRLLSDFLHGDENAKAQLRRELLASDTHRAQEAGIILMEESYVNFDAASDSSNGCIPIPTRTHFFVGSSYGTLYKIYSGPTKVLVG